VKYLHKCDLAVVQAHALRLPVGGSVAEQPSRHLWKGIHIMSVTQTLSKCPLILFISVNMIKTRKIQYSMYFHLPI